MAYSEVQYPSQHCAARNVQFQPTNMQFYPGMSDAPCPVVTQSKSWYPNEDHNANNFQDNRNYQRTSPPERSHMSVWNPMMSQAPMCNMNMYNMPNNGGFVPNGAYRQRINSATSDSYPQQQHNQWMSQQSPTMPSPTNQFVFSRSRQSSITDSGHLTPDNAYKNGDYHVQQGYGNLQQCLPSASNSYPYTSTPSNYSGSSSTNMQPFQLPHENAILPQGQLAPPSSVPSKSGSDWELQCMGVGMKLSNSGLWKNFENVVIEMVISKHGRRMFPVLEYEFTGLDPTKLYNVFLDFVLASCYVWKYVDQRWQPNGLASNEEPEFQPGQCVYLHPNSPAPGDTWNKKGASFTKMKLSNHFHDKEKIITLRTLHKYQPRLHIVEVDRMNPSIQSNLRTFVLPKTTFMTVTLYHDTDVAQLKINLNPFARSFRDKSLTKKTSEDHCSSSGSSMSQTLSPVTSPEEVDQSGRDGGDGDAIDYDPNDIVKVENPVNSIDLQLAKDFLHKQLNVMSQLVRTSEELERNSSAPNHSNTSKDVKHKSHSNDAGETLEELLKPQTVHHFAPPGAKSTKHEKKVSTNNNNNNNDSLANYQLLNVDRCFPPNAVAPVSNKLPFDPNTLNSNHKEASPSLPAFYGCSLYREQAAAAAKSFTNSDNADRASNLPVVYVPNNAGESSDKQQQLGNNLPAVSSQSPTTTCFQSPTRQHLGQVQLPTLSPGCLRDILYSDDLGSDFPVSLKRKHDYADGGDSDDDVFADSPSVFDFMQSHQAKRNCFEEM